MWPSPRPQLLCKVMSDTCWFAAWNGHMDCLVYVRENGCPWDADTCIYATKRGQIDCLAYAQKNGCPLDWSWDNMRKRIFVAWSACLTHGNTGALEMLNVHTSHVLSGLRRSIRLANHFFTTRTNSSNIVLIHVTHRLYFYHDKLDRYYHSCTSFTQYARFFHHFSLVDLF